MQPIDQITWLKHTLSYFGVHEVVVQHSHHLHSELGQQIQCQISFSIAPRRRGGNPINISAVGTKSHVSQPAVTQKNAVMGCVTKLQEHGYTLPTFSFLLMTAKSRNMLDDVAGFAANQARSNQNDVVISIC